MFETVLHIPKLNICLFPTKKETIKEKKEKEEEFYVLNLRQQCRNKQQQMSESLCSLVL